jgi:condensin complex subunit 3
VFFETFTTILQASMVSMQKNPNLDRCIDFVSKFSSNASTKPSTNKENSSPNTLANKESHEQTNNGNETTSLEEESENPFLSSLMDWLIDNLKANSDAVRYRCCNILSKLMAAINNEQFIDEDLYDRLCDGLLERLKDVNSRVQVQAITAIYRLQDPNDKDCRVIKALLFLMSFDPNWQVRYQAISNIAFSKMTLSDIIDRVRDPSPFVRRKAIFILSEKVLIKFISIEKRLFILNYSLKDEDASVLDTCCKKLLPSWLAHKENDLCKLLKALDVVDATETAELMLNSMYKESSIETITNEFIELLNER